jgi:hypothetical protein
VRQTGWQRQPDDCVLDLRPGAVRNRLGVDVEHAQHDRRDRLAEAQHHVGRGRRQHGAVGRHRLHQRRMGKRMPPAGEREKESEQDEVMDRDDEGATRARQVQCRCPFGSRRRNGAGSL